MRIGCSGPVSGRSGIGVVQKHLYSHLAKSGHELTFSATRDIGTTTISRMRGLTRGFRAARGPMDVYLSTVPPLPLKVNAPLMSIVYDLRWQRTRSRLGAAYRAWDLHRTVKHSDSLICISENTRRELIAFDRHAADIAVSKLLGPGHIPDDSFQESNTGIVMLVGGAPHKRNEDAAAALALRKLDWVRGVIGVGVSEKVRTLLSDQYLCEWYDRISDAKMLELYQRAEYFMMLGTEEGFGLPFVEALATGCQVIATNHPLAREVVGQAGMLIEPGTISGLAAQLTLAPAISPQVRIRHASEYSWQVFAEACERELLRLVENG